MIERYTTSINKIFDEEQKLELQLLVEREIARAHAQSGTISFDAYYEIEKYCTPEFVKLERVQEIEEQLNHDVMAMVTAAAEQCPTPTVGGFLHLGATSMDIQDTVLGLQLTKAKNAILESLKVVIIELSKKAEENKEITCIGRTHGQHALPTTYGFKFANFTSEFLYAKRQLEEAQVNYGKIGGAIGTYASFGSTKVEQEVLKRLDLQNAPITTQVIPRVVFMPFLNSLISITGVAERLAKEIRNLQRPEIAEVFEEFTGKQVGSSTMPHKRNPHKSERICGLTRIVRALYHAGAENIALEHERDLTNSAPERIEFQDMIGLTDYILQEMAKIVKSLRLDHEKILHNLYLLEGRQCTERIMMRLAGSMGRQKAHRLLSKLADEANFKQAILANAEIKRYMPTIDSEIDELLDPKNYIGLSIQKTDEVLKLVHRNYPQSYVDSGVDIYSEHADIARIGEWVKESFAYGSYKVMTEFGHYANLVKVNESQALALKVDGVGSIVLIAELVQNYDTIGIDCVAMNINDLLCMGITPIGFADYLAVNGSLGVIAGEIAKGMVEGCKLAHIPLLGGEFATLPDIISGIRPPFFDLAGCALGQIDPKNLITGKDIKVGDIIFGIPSNGLHSNGFTLVRKLVLAHHSLDSQFDDKCTWAEELLRPTRIYLDEILGLIKLVQIKGIAHITGGAFTKLKRLTKLGFMLEKFPPLPNIMKQLQQMGNLSNQEMAQTFNLGIGMIIVVSSDQSGKVAEYLSQYGGFQMGTIINEIGVFLKPYGVKL